MRVLVAEDNRLQGRVLVDRLRKLGYEVDLAEDGQIALAKAREQRPSIIVSDIEMPNMDGHEFCRAIKSDPDLRTVPLILLSTLSDPVDIIKGLDCGADNYVTKPYRTEYLISRMKSLLETPLGEEENPLELEVNLGGQSYTVRSGRQQILNLLVSTFENAVEKNAELHRYNEDLTIAKDQLGRSHSRLQTLHNRMQRDLDAAARVQHSLLPQSDRGIDGLDVEWRYIPCDELAGDFLNYFQLDEDHVALFVVDVSGHGVASSLLSVTIGRTMTADVEASSLLVKIAEDGTTKITEPAEVAAELNRRFPMEDQGDLYFTLVYAVLDLRNRMLRYASAGHNAIVMQRAGAKPSLLPAAGFAIGWMEDIQYDQHEIQLQSGDRVFFYSDGIPEALDEALTEFDEPRMLELMHRCRPLDLGTTADTMVGAVKHWCRVNGPKDDVSLLVIELK